MPNFFQVLEGRTQSLLAFDESEAQHPALLRVVLDDLQVQGFGKGLCEAGIITLFNKLKASKRGVHVRVGMTAVLGTIVVAYMVTRTRALRLRPTQTSFERC